MKLPLLARHRVHLAEIAWLRQENVSLRRIVSAIRALLLGERAA